MAVAVIHLYPSSFSRHMRDFKHVWVQIKAVHLIDFVCKQLFAERNVFSLSVRAVCVVICHHLNQSLQLFTHLEKKVSSQTRLQSSPTVTLEFLPINSCNKVFYDLLIVGRQIYFLMTFHRAWSNI